MGLLTSSIPSPKSSSSSFSTALESRFLRLLVAVSLVVQTASAFPFLVVGVPHLFKGGHRTLVLQWVVDILHKVFNMDRSRKKSKNSRIGELMRSPVSKKTSTSSALVRMTIPSCPTHCRAHQPLLWSSESTTHTFMLPRRMQY